MNKLLLLPRLSITGIRKNGSAYVPYIMAGIFSVFIFFVFSSILHNDIMKKLPHSEYIWVLMQIGQVLLGLILIPFLIYTNSFLIKRRKKELGLYSILGLEKKHIAFMMLWETLFIFGIAAAGGILLGLVFSKLMCLILLNMAGMPVDTSFSFSLTAVWQTLVYFLATYGLNLSVNLFHVYKSNPNDLLKDPKKGDREPRRLWFNAMLGFLFLTAGYIIAIRAKIDSGIFLNFLLAVTFVVIGTHQFFKAGLIALLKILKKNNRFYYRKSNYVTVSGMLHRMKKSASSLSNICIFSTMVIITLLCTLALWRGTGSIQYYQYPFDVVMNMNATGDHYDEAVDKRIEQVSKDTQVSVGEKISFTYTKLHTGKKGNGFRIQNSSYLFPDRYAVKLISLQDYNRIEQKQETLSDNEVMVFAKGKDFGYSQLILGKEVYKVRKELKEVVFEKKATNDKYGQDYYIIVKNDAIIENLRNEFKSFAANDRIFSTRMQLTGPEKNKKEFISRISDWMKRQKDYNSTSDGISGREDVISMTGGLLFLGIFFSIVFTMCLILIMYYKQITEGYDDRENFDIMQKVGMSDPEVRGTIRKQILMVFFLPLLVAIFHTMAAFTIISGLLSVMYLFDTQLIILCGIAVVCFFAALYGLSYAATSKTYYGIVKQMN